MAKRIIWTSEIDVDRWDFDPECTGKNPDEMTEEEKFDYCTTLNAEYLEDERINLSHCYAHGAIIAIADLGLWYGRRTGYKYVKSVSDCLYANCDAAEWYCDEYNFRAIMTHHDGTNYILYRVLKPDLSEKQIETFEQKIIEGKLTQNDITRYTKSLRPAIAEIYGWPQHRIIKKANKKKIA